MLKLPYFDTPNHPYSSDRLQLKFDKYNFSLSSMLWKDTLHGRKLSIDALKFHQYSLSTKIICFEVPPSKSQRYGEEWDSLSARVSRESIRSLIPDKMAGVTRGLVCPADEGGYGRMDDSTGESLSVPKFLSMNSPDPVYQAALEVFRSQFRPRHVNSLVIALKH
ncbi:hypothetical protein SK128_002890 [Halocaridina rubra]|uniref:Uncharacterized protein n=1 Tax=Halocaridina rubra TaxID=373956 RepID=A0AAN8X0S5_HALRR